MSTRIHINTGIACAAILLAACLPALAGNITIPKGTDVELLFDQSLSSKSAHAGDRVMLHVANDVQVDGRTVISSGTKVTGYVTKVEKRKHFGVNAKLKLAFNDIRSTSGQMIAVDAGGKGSTVGSRTGEAAAVSGGSALVLGPIGLAGGYFVVGKQVNVKPGDKISVDVAHDTIVKLH